MELRIKLYKYPSQAALHLMGKTKPKYWLHTYLLIMTALKKDISHQFNSSILSSHTQYFVNPGIYLCVQNSKHTM